MMELDSILSKRNIPEQRRKDFIRATNLMIGHSRDSDESLFHPEDEQLLEALAAPISLLLENARLSEQLADTLYALDNLTHELMESKYTLGKLEQELHDGTGQLLTVLKINLSLVYEELAEGDVKQRQRIQDSMSLTDEIMNRLRRVARESPYLDIF